MSFVMRVLYLLIYLFYQVFGGLTSDTKAVLSMVFLGVLLLNMVIVEKK